MLRKLVSATIIALETFELDEMELEDSRMGVVCLELYSRIDGTKFLGRIYHWVSEEGFHEVLINSVNAVSNQGKRVTYLTIIKRAVNAQTVNIWILNRCHLCLLYRADLPSRIHDEDRDIFLAPQAVYCGRSSISACSSNNCQMFPFFARLPLIPSDQEELKQIT